MSELQDKWMAQIRDEWDRAQQQRILAQQALLDGKPSAAAAASRGAAEHAHTATQIVSQAPLGANYYVQLVASEACKAAAAASLAIEKYERAQLQHGMPQPSEPFVQSN